MRAEMIDTRSYRSAGSERSDELSLRSLRRAGGTYKREKMPVSVGIITVMMFIAGGAILFAVWEDWNVFDGAYYSFITLRYVSFYIALSIGFPTKTQSLTFDWVVSKVQVNHGY
ncbi:unnamed protein product [Anisakis simplex]|uniref:Ion_trans_2 domain-containing protein n=1 Tax=Anisakis simplex TaxID=6269 RepID=A0A0M3JPP9_ANISI|nr:unnamed protein product [Anisakis simplex]